MIQVFIVIVYLLSTILIGIWSKKKSNSTKAFEGANLGVLLCVVAGAGEWLGGTATTGVSEYGYVYGISGAWYTIANGLGICFLAVFFAKLFRSLEKPTVSGIIGNFIGKDAKVVSSILLIFIMVSLGAVPMVAIGTLGESLFGWNSAFAILLMGCGVLIYTFFGGMMAVGYTNILHMTVMYLGAILAVILGCININGLEGLTTNLPESYFSPFTIGYPKVSSWLIASVLGACTAQAGLQPILGAKDEKTAVKSSFWIAVLVAPFGILTAILGMIAKVQFPDLPNAKLALPTLLMSLNPVAGGLVIASIIAAVLSTASPIFLACGTLFTRDIYQEIVKDKDVNDKQLLKVSRVTTCIAGGVCIMLAIVLGKSSTILDLTYFAYSLRGSLFVILLLGIYWKKTSQRSAILAMILTSIAGLFWIIYKNVFGEYPIHPAFSETYIAVLVALVTTIIGSIFMKNKHNEKR